MDKPFFSVIIVSHNSEPYLPGCLDSIFINSSNIPLEIIVVDNGSNDNSCGLIQNNYKMVTLIKNSNTGFGSGCNLGANQAKGKFLLFINPDSIIHEKFFPAIIKNIQKSSIIIQPVILHMENHSLINTCGNNIHITGMGTLNYNLQKFNPADEYGDIFAVSGACFTIGKSDFDKLGGFDENIFLYCEDTELSIKAYQLGFKILLCKEAIVYHDYHFKMSPEKFFFQEFGRLYNVKKHYNAFSIFCLGPSFLVMEIIIWFFVLVRGPKYIKKKIKSYISVLQTSTSRFKNTVFPIEILTPIFDFTLITNDPIYLSIGKVVNIIFRGNFQMYRTIIEKTSVRSFFGKLL